MERKPKLMPFDVFVHKQNLELALPRPGARWGAPLCSLDGLATTHSKASEQSSRSRWIICFVVRRTGSAACY